MYANQSKSSIIGLAAGTSMEPPPTPQASEVFREHADLRQSVDILARVVTELAERLQPVIMQVPVAEKRTSGQTEGQCYSAVGTEIRIMREGVRVQTERLAGLLESLAV